MLYFHGLTHLQYNGLRDFTCTVKVGDPEALKFASEVSELSTIPTKSKKILNYFNMLVRGSHAEVSNHEKKM